MGSVWGEFGVSLDSVRAFGPLDGHFAMIVDSPWVYEGPLSKNTHFPTYFNDFIKLFGGLWVDLRLLWGRFWRMKVTLEPLSGHFGITFGM